MNLNQVTLPATDVAASVEFYQALGLRLIVDSIPRYARLECPDGGATLSVHHVHRPPDTTGVIVYLECAELDRICERLSDRGLRFIHPPRDEHWLWREARMLDPAGNQVCLYYAGENRRFPPWRI